MRSVAFGAAAPTEEWLVSCIWYPYSVQKHITFRLWRHHRLTIEYYYYYFIIRQTTSPQQLTCLSFSRWILSCSAVRVGRRRRWRWRIGERMVKPDLRQVVFVVVVVGGGKETTEQDTAAHCLSLSVVYWWIIEFRSSAIFDIFQYE